MSYLVRRYLVPLGVIVAGVAGFAVWVRFMAPGPLRHAFAAGAPRSHPRFGGVLRWAAALVLLVAHVLLLVVSLVVVLLGVLVGLRLRARRVRSVVWGELQLGRDDQATPYEVSKLFDGLAGTLRPPLLHRLLRGPDTLTLRVSSGPGSRPVRLLVGAPGRFHAAIAARITATYPDVKLTPVDHADIDPLGFQSIVSPVEAFRARRRGERVGEVGVVVRCMKARRWVWALATTKDYEHAPIESLLAAMHALGAPCLVDLLLTPAPAAVERMAGWLVHRRERSYLSEYALSDAEPGVESVVAQKHLKGAVEGVGRAWWWFDHRILTPHGRVDAARLVAGVVQETRAENHLRPRVMRARRRLYAWRAAQGLPPLWPALWTGALCSTELASLWQLPTLRLKSVPVNRVAARWIPASPLICRDPAYAILYDQNGPLGIAPGDLRKGLMLLGAPGAGKSTALATHLRSLAEDRGRALIVVDPKEDFAREALGLIPADRQVHYLDLGHPRWGLNILSCGDLSAEVRADVFISVLRELAGESAVGARSDMFLRAAIQTAVTVERTPALQHVGALLDLQDPGYRRWATRELCFHPETEYLQSFWGEVFERQARDSRRFLAEALVAPLNKLARFTGTPALNLLTIHPRQLDLQQIIHDRGVLVVNGSKGAVGDENANLLCALLVILIGKTLHQQQRRHPDDRVDVSLLIDEAHNVFTGSFATLLSEGRSARLQVTAAFQYTGQIVDERVRSAIKSCLQNISIFRLREFQDARAAASLAMGVFTDSIKGEVTDQRRLRLDPTDIVCSPDYQAANLWLADGAPQPVFTANTRRLPQASKVVAARERHECEQLLRGYHPHDHGRYIRPPLVRSIDTPLIAQHRTIHVDLTGWAACPPPREIRRVVLVLQPLDGGQALAVACQPEDHSGRRFHARLAEQEGAISWVPVGRYRTVVVVWAVGETAPRIWAREAAGFVLDVTDEPRRTQPAEVAA